MSTDEVDIRNSLLEYNYAQAPVALVGSVASAGLIVAFIARSGWQPALWPWLAAHLVVTLGGFIVVLRWRRGDLLHSHGRALTARRVLSLCFGLLWGAAGLLWPLSTGNTGIAVLLCTTGLAAAASNTSAADPVSAILFNLLAFLPPFVLQAPNDAWLSGLLVLYLTAITVVGLRNHAILKTSLALRSSNSQLLEQARAEQRATLAEKQRAELAVAARTRFLAAASHDLRQPVQAMTLFADVLAHETSETKREEITSALGRTSQALSAMLESLLDLSRLDAGAAVPAPAPISIARLLEDIVSGLRGEAEARGMVIQAAGRRCQVWADRTMLSRVVSNLAVNAVRHGGGRVLLSSRKRGDLCLVQVWDQGPGIAEADRERIFEELVQLENRERDRAKGLGIGLSMVRRLCELNDWHLSIQSRVGQGTVFAIALPMAAAEPPAGRRSSPPENRALSVLLVEDDRDVREAMGAWLERHGCKVHAAGSASEALTLWDQQHATGSSPEVLITDYGLPGDMSGERLALTLREQVSDLPIVIMTGALSLPFGDDPPRGITVLRKPVKGELLWQTVRDALEALR